MANLHENASSQYPAVEEIEHDLAVIGEFLAQSLTRRLDFEDPEAPEPLPPGFRLLGPHELVSWSRRGFAWRGRESEGDE